VSRGRVLTRARLYVVGAALLALAVSFAAFAIGWSAYTVRQRTEDLSRQVAALSKGLAAAEAIVPGSSVAAQDVRDRLFRVQARLLGTALFVADDDGTVERSSTDASITTLPFERLGEPDSNGVRTGTGQAGDGSSVLIVAAPFGDQVGTWLVAAQPLSDVRTAQLGLLAVAAASLLLAAIVSWFAGGVLARRLTDPLVRLRDATESVTGGAWGAQVPEAGDDEIASLARSFNRMSSRVADAYAAQKAFVGDVSHELRTPVTSIRGFSEAIIDGTVTKPDDVRRSVGIIHSEALRMTEISDTLLALAELDSGTVSPSCEVIDLTGVVDALVGRHAGPAEKAGLVLSLDIPLVPRPIGDSERLLQAASQLVSNAIRYTPAGGRVRVSARSVGDEWLLSIDDSGPGIPPDKREEIFERFTRLDESRAKRAGGTGLGLAICRRVVELMGGRVWVEDAYLGGARFVIALPCSSARS
jgi:signal transduction histidine kinase